MEVFPRDDKGAVTAGSGPPWCLGLVSLPSRCFQRTAAFKSQFWLVLGHVFRAIREVLCVPDRRHLCLPSCLSLQRLLLLLVCQREAALLGAVGTPGEGKGCLIPWCLAEKSLKGPVLPWACVQGLC